MITQCPAKRTAYAPACICARSSLLAVLQSIIPCRPGLSGERTDQEGPPWYLFSDENLEGTELGGQLELNLEAEWPVLAGADGEAG